MPVTIMTYDRKAPFPDSFREKLEKADFRVEFDGGLGDVIYQLHATKMFDTLMNCGPTQTGSIVLVCHNPHAKEIFQWLPAQGDISVADCGFEDIRKVSFRQSLNLPLLPAPKLGRRDVSVPLPFFPSPQDEPALRELEALKPFIILAPCGSSASKMIPRAAVLSMHRVAREAGFKTVMIGRTYRMFISGELRMPHHEMQFEDLEGHLDLVDELTVPGVAAAVKMSAGVVAPNTATLILGQCLDRPCLLAGQDHDYRTFIPSAPSGYMFRLTSKGHGHFPINDYTEKVMRTFVGGLR